MNEEQLAQLVQLLVQAGAALDENQAMQIVLMASQGDELAQLIVQQVIQLALGATPSARLGAKLTYLKKLKGICPEGQELQFFKIGGKVCKACMGKKMQKGGEATKSKKTKLDQAAKDSIAANYGRGTGDATVQNINGGYKKNKNGKVVWVPNRNEAPYKKAKGGLLANKGTAFGDGIRGANPRNTDRGGHKSHGNTKAASYMKKTNVPNKFTAFGDTGKKKPTNVGLVGHRATGQTGRLQSKYTTSDNVNKHTAFGAHINRSHRGSAACPSTRGWKKIKGAPRGGSGQSMGWKRYANGGTLTEAFQNTFFN